MECVLQPCVELATARRIWEGLGAEAVAEDVHQTFMGFSAWALSDPSARPLPLLAAYRGGRPMALLAVWRRWHSARGIRLGVLEPAGSDHWRIGMPVLAPETEESVTALLEGLRGLIGWDMLELGPMPVQSRAAQLLLSEGHRLGLSARAVGEIDDPVVKLGDSFDSYYAGRSGNLRSQVKRGEARLEAAGRVEFEEYTGGDDLDQRLEDFFRIEASGWKGREGTAIAQEPEVRRFYASLAHQAAARGWLRLYSLSVGGQAVAADYCLAHRGTVYMLKVGYDEAWSHCSPGQVIRKRVIEHLFAGGHSEIYDLMPGGGNHRDYKLRWANHSRPWAVVRMFNPRSVKGRLAAAASGMRRWWRRRRQTAAAEDERVLA